MTLPQEVQLLKPDGTQTDEATSLWLWAIDQPDSEARIHTLQVQRDRQVRSLPRD